MTSRDMLDEVEEELGECGRMSRWVIADGDTELAVVEALSLTRTVTVRQASQTPVAYSPELADQFRNALGLAAGLARSNTGPRDA